MKNNTNDPPIAYFITFETFGTRVPGDKRGSVDRRHNEFGTVSIKPNVYLEQSAKKSQTEEKLILNSDAQQIVLQAIIDICKDNHWNLHAAHVRTNHIHMVAEGRHKPEIIMTRIKSKATKYLKKSHLKIQRKDYWARHGSTKYLYDFENYYRAMRYTIERQGKPLALYYDKSYDDIKPPIECAADCLMK